MDDGSAEAGDDEDAACATVETAPETFSWQNIRRPLPCRFVQPGGLAW
jgi:hypothetical protein